MASSLASQLAQVRSLNADRLTNAKLAARAQSASYLFPPSIAATQDFDTLHGLAVNGWEELCMADASFEKWNDTSGLADLLFGENSRDQDRLTKTKTENAAIDEAISDFLYLVGDSLLDRSAGKCIEWLVRRFRVHEYNVDVLLGAFMPFHDTPEFARILRIVSLKEKPHLSFLIPVQRKAVPLPASVLLSTLLGPPETTSSTVTLRWIMNLPLKSSGRTVHQFKRTRQALLSFWVSTIVKLCSHWAGSGDIFVRMGLSKSDGKRKATRDDDAQFLLSVMLPSALELISSAEAERDTPIFGSMALCAMANAFELSADAASRILASLASFAAQSKKARTALLTACSCIVSRQAAVHSDATEEATARLVGPDVAAGLAKIVTSSHTLAEHIGVYDFDPFLYQLGLGLVDAVQDKSKDPACQEALTWIVEGDKVVTEITATSIVVYALSRAQSGLSAPLLDVLAQLRQRRPRVVEEGFRAALQTASKETRDSLDKVMGVLLAYQAGSAIEPDGKDTAMWLGAHGADAMGRLTTLRKVLASVKSGSLKPSDKFLQDTLTSMLSDTEAGVVATIYDQQDLLMQVLGVETVIQALTSVLRPTNRDDRMPRTVLSLHWRYVLSTLIGEGIASPEQQSRIWSDSVWPRLLCTKSDRKASHLLLSVLVNNNFETKKEASVVATRLASVARAIQPSLSKDDLASVNLALVDALGASIAHLQGHDAFANEVNFLLHNMNSKHTGDAAARGRLLAALTMRSILSRSQGNRLSYAARELVRYFGSNIGMLGLHNSITLGDLDESTLAGLIFVRTSSGKTLGKVCAALYLALAQHIPLEGCGTLAANSSAGVPVKTLFSLVVASLMHQPPVAAAIIGVLLTRMGDAALVFLASMWTGSKENGQFMFDSEIRLVAIRYSLAFLSAFSSADKGQGSRLVDFQTIVPSYLVALKDVEKRIRLEALAGVVAILRVTTSIAEAESAVQALEIFGYDTLYGTATVDGLKYLDFVDVANFLQTIADAGQSFINDFDYLDSWMHSNMNSNKDDDKKSKKYKSAIVHCLSSHVLCWENVAVRLALLGAMASVKHSRKLSTLSPLIQRSIEASPSTDIDMPDNLIKLLFSTYDKPTRKLFSEGDADYWPLFKQAIVQAPARVQRQAAIVLRDQLYSLLPADKQAEIVMLLANTIANTASPVPRELRACLASLNIDNTIVVGILARLRESIADNLLLNGPSSKKNRSEMTSSTVGLESTAVLVELLEANLPSKSLPSPLLVTDLFEVLRMATEMHLAGISVAEHVMQITMSNLSRALDKLNATDAPEVFEPMRVDALINVVKTPCRPQTFQQALLLLSIVGKSAPDLVLQHSMPIFTFVGSTMLQRDDEYSFVVIEKTLQSTLPPVVQEIRSRFTSNEDSFSLMQAARNLLCIFTDAATHIPRHRRQNFFHLLATVMGQRDFLTAICMLLVDRQAYKVVRLQTDEETKTTFQLPLSLFKRAEDDVGTQLRGLGEVWDEAMRTWEHRAEDPIEMQENVFLDCVRHIDSEHESRKLDAIKRITALLRFVKLAVIDNREALEEGRVDENPEEAHVRDQTLQNVVQDALALSHVDDELVARAAQDALDEIMTIISVSTLHHVVTALVGSQEVSSICNGLQIFVSSVEGMLADERHKAAAFTPHVIQSCEKLLGNSSSSQQALIAALDALSAIASQPVSNEHAALSDLLLPVAKLAQMQHHSDAVSGRALDLLRRLSEVLGPRLIPKLVELVTVCKSIVQVSTGDVARQRGALTVLNALARSVPTFMSSHLPGLLELCVAMPDVAELDAMRKTIVSATRFIAPADFLQAVFSTHEHGDKKQASLHLFCLEAVLLCMRQMGKVKLVAHYKSIFRFLVVVFDARRQCIIDPNQWALSDAEVSAIERKSVGVFTRLVFRLNEATFRPLFLRLCDWALVDLGEEEEAKSGTQHKEVQARQTVLYKVLNALLEELGELISHYYVNVLDGTIETLQRMADDGVEQSALWEPLMTSVKLSARIDKGTFWNQARVNKIVPGLVAQIGTPFVQSSPAMERLLADGLTALCQTVNDEACLKLTNNLLLDLARETTTTGLAAKESSHSSASHMRMRIVAVRTLQRVWRAKGCEDGLLTLVPETVPSIAELLQESEEAMQQAMSGLVGAIEEILGEGLDAYLQ